ncbi:MAG TPA: DUF364 domain-containing protein [Azospirillaceae bacterium]|nr:DUF364 domain-containing protein [Azospirillaceae bacterium]
MRADPLLLPLAGAVPDAAVRRVVVGLNWTLVEAETGCGLAHTPERGAAGCRPLAGAGGLAGLGLRALAALVAADNPVEAAIGLAAVNAAHNVPGTAGEAANGLDLFADIAAGTVVLGRFPGLETRLPGARVVERDPRPGEVAEADAGPLLAAARGIVMTASALLNGGVGRALAQAAPDARVALVGPGTPLAPALHAAGIAILSGLVVTDPDGAARAVAEAGAVKALAPFSRPVTLRRG